MLVKMLLSLLVDEPENDTKGYTQWKKRVEEKKRLEAEKLLAQKKEKYRADKF